MIVSTLTLFWMKRDNRRREGRIVAEELSGVSPEEESEMDWKHPQFRWRP